MLPTASVSHSGYAEDVTSRLALRTGWTQAEVLALRDGRSLGDDKLGSLIAVVREAAGRAGQVDDVTWERAAACAQTPNDLSAAVGAVGANGTE